MTLSKTSYVNLEFIDKYVFSGLFIDNSEFVVFKTNISLESYRFSVRKCVNIESSTSIMANDMFKFRTY